MIKKSFGKDNRWGAGILQEYRHKVHDGTSKTDQWFMRPSVSYNALPWLKFQYQVDFASTSSGFDIKLTDCLTFNPHYNCYAYHNYRAIYNRRSYDDHVIYFTFTVKL